TERNDLYAEYEDAVFYQNDVYVPTDYEATTVKTRSPLPSHIINTVVAALTKNGPQVQFQPTKTGDRGQENAELRSHFFEASLRRQEEESENRFFRLFMSALVMKGEGILKTLERKKMAWAEYGSYTRKLAAKLDDPEDEDYRDVVWRSGGAGGKKREQDEDSRKRVLMAKTEEWKRGQPYPITTSDVLPETFFYLKTLEGMSFAAEVKMVPYLDTLARYGAGLTKGGQVVAREAMGVARNEWTSAMEGIGSLTMYETWDADHVCYWLAGPGAATSSSSKSSPRGTLVKKIKHRYGDKTRRTLRGPYFHALGITTHSRLPHRAGLGILYGFLDLFKLLDSLLTIQSNAAFLTGYPAYADDGTGGMVIPARVGDFGDDNADGAGGSGSASMRVTPGRILPRGVRPIDQPRGSVVLDKVMADVRGFIELALPSVVQGVVSGGESGYALNQAAHLARLAWDPIVSNAEFALSRRVGFESWLIEDRIQEPVYIWGEQPTSGAQRRRQSKAGWLAIGPKNLDGVHRYTVKLDPDTPSDQVIKGRTHETLLGLKLETIDDAILDVGGNPEEVERWWQLYEFKQLPEIKQQIHQKALEKLRIKQQQALAGPDGQQDLTMPEPGAQAIPGGPQMPPSNGAGPNVFQPGQGGMPLQPTPGGSVTGVGPPGRQMAGGMAGMPVTPGMPARHQPLP
ncbi:MAG TPA: hypothetical protein VNM48_05785, partial [Chloroflexota bacterium]|nr:hypothetical protein [Chloroflexota bacterium]